MQNDAWQYSTSHNSTCKVVEEHTLWGRAICRIWLPDQGVVVRVPKSTLKPLATQSHPEIEQAHIAYVAAAAKVSEVLEGSALGSDGNVLLAPMESRVIPLPHQIHALSRAISGDRIRYLLADEVGLGKTVEAGLILRELKLRGLVKRTLVVAPKSIAMQWIGEMNTHFNETFALINPGDLDALERLERPERMFDTESSKDYNPWLRFPQAVVTLDAVKPLTKRRGWSKEKIQFYNLNRYEKLVHGQWDLIIVDESHRLGGSTDQVARFKLGQGLAEASPYLLLLSATPHQGKSDSFARLMSLLDPMTFPDEESVTQARVSEFVIRTEKRKAVTSQGKPLFIPRTTRTQKINLQENQKQVDLYEEVSAYVKEGYNQAIKDRKPHIGFLMVLLQRIVTSSTYAIRCTLERRLNVLEDLHNQESSINEDDMALFPELDGQELLEQLIEVNEPGRVAEMDRVKFLLSLARDAENSGPDVKTTVLMDLIYEFQGQENDDQLKLLIFTEFIPTQKMLKKFLEDRGIECAGLNGSMSMEERRIAQKIFREKARILISTDAGGEGLNLQFCHVVINYDLPWNPMRIEQRIGRVDRIGQNKIVKAINFVYENSVEDRVREVLETKLAVILDELGIDKTDDILDSSLSGEMVEKMMTQVLMEDADPDTRVEEAISDLRGQITAVREDSAVYGISEDPEVETAEKIRTHPLPYWVERMTISFLKMKNCKVGKDLFGWNLVWPDGERSANVQFQSENADSNTNVLTLENNRVRGLALNLPGFPVGQPIPVVSIDGLPSTVKGVWGLFEIRLQAGLNSDSQYIRIPMVRKRYLTIFISHDKKVFLPTARHIWDSIQTTDPKIHGITEPEQSIELFNLLSHEAEKSGLELFEDLKKNHDFSISREENRGAIAFAARRKAIEKVGLPEVRQYRLNRCEEEELEWKAELESARQVLPEMRPLILMGIEEDVA